MPRYFAKERSAELYEAIARLSDAEECRRFFDDLCSISELHAIEQRFEVAKLLNAGQVYTDIMDKTHASSATISRVNRVLNYGSGTLSDVINRLSSADAQKA